VTLAIGYPPATLVEAVTEILHGVAVTDPYRWLEGQNSLHTREWIDKQTVYARTYLDTLPGRDRIKKRVGELLDVDAISSVCKVGDRYFYLKRSPHQEQPVIAMREGIEPEVVLVDPAKT
jgi:prolyl oligopeptidase